MKTLLIPIIFLIAACPLLAQSLLCGTIQAPAPTTSNPDSIVLDRFGNRYNIKDLQIPTTGLKPAAAQNSINTGYFNLIFPDDIPADIQMEVCSVFAQLATWIPQRQIQSGCGSDWAEEMVDIDVQWVPLDPGIGGTGTPYYSGPFDFACTEMVLDRPFITINGGHVQNVGVPDGLLQINSSLTWHTGPANPPVGVPDLYSVVLHEALHILGFASRIGLAGAEEFSLWDRNLLIANGGNPAQTIGVLTNPSGCIQNCWTANANIANLAQNQCASGAAPNLLVGSVALAPLAGGPDLLQGLSHLGDQCTGEAYVMSPVLVSNGIPRRVPRPVEFQVLVDLGYNVQAPTVQDDGCFNIAHIDQHFNGSPTCCYRYLFGCAGETIEVLAADLLCNDITNADDRQITRVWSLSASITIVPNAAGTGWNITLPSNSSFEDIYYTVTGCDCRQHNARFNIKINEQCPACTFTPDVCDNLLCDGDFEDYTNTTFPIESHFGWPIIFENSASVGTPDIYVDNGNHFVYVGDFPYAREAIVLPLQQCVEPGCSLTLALDLAMLAGSSAMLEVWGSENRPCSALATGQVTPISNMCSTATTCGVGGIFDPACVAQFSTAIGSNTLVTPTFETLPTQTWPNTTTHDVCFLTFVPNGPLVFDNVVATRTCTPTLTITPPTTTEVCPGDDVTLTYDICAPAIPGVTQTTVTPTITLPPGWQLAGPPPGAFTLAAGECIPLTLVVTIPATAQPGDVGAIDLGLSATGVCSTAQVSHLQELTVVDCPPAFTCNCPAGPNSYAVGDPGQPTLITATNLPATVAANACIAVLGDLVIDDDMASNTPFTYTLDNCEVIMQPGARIIVPERCTLVVRDGHVHGCPDAPMWRTIHVQTRGFLQASSGVIMEDAQRAITLDNKSGLRLTGATLRNNYIGLYTAPQPPGSLHIGFLELTLFDNEFHGENLALHPAFDADIVFSAGAGAYAGIHFNDVGFSSIGNFISPANRFHHLANGILLDRSHSVISRPVFRDIMPSSLHPGVVSGYAVRARGNGEALAVQCEAAATPAAPNFVNCTYGVEATGVPATVRFNRMDNAHIGVRLAESGFNALTVRDNAISCLQHGIEVYQCDMLLPCS